MDTTIRQQNNAVQNQWYNLGSVQMSVPIGAWHLYYNVPIGVSKGSSVYLEAHASLSTSNNSETDADITTIISINPDSDINFSVSNFKYKSVSSKTNYYFIIRTSREDSPILYLVNNRTAVARIRASCSYL